jgi:hypothetical protein
VANAAAKAVDAKTKMLNLDRMMLIPPTQPTLAIRKNKVVKFPWRNCQAFSTTILSRSDSGKVTKARA